MYLWVFGLLIYIGSFSGFDIFCPSKKFEGCDLMLCRCGSFVCIISGRCAWILLSYGMYCNCDKVFTAYPVGSEAIAWSGPESCFGRVLYLVFSKFCCRFIGNVVTGKLKMSSLFCNCEVYLCMLIKMSFVALGS